MGQLIILEGPDGAGKTTLAKQLSTLKTTQYINNGPYTSPHHAYEAFKKQLELAPLLIGSIIIDRLHYSEFVYSSALKRDSMIAKEYNELEQMIIDQNGIIVMCLPAYEICHKNWHIGNQKGEEMVKKKEIFDDVYELYKNYDSDANTKLIDSDANTKLIFYDYKNPFLGLMRIIGELL